MIRHTSGAISALILGFLVASGCATGAASHPDGGKILPAGDGGHKDSGPNPGDDSGNPNPGNDSGGSCVTAPPSNVCGVAPQCGCGNNSTCEVDQQALDGSSSCVPAGSKTLGQACTQTAGECAQGLTCIWNVCRPYCGNAGGTCTVANTNACINLTDQSSNPIPNLLVCRLDCALQDTSSCGGGGEGCVYIDTDQTDCYPVGTSTANCNATTSFCPAGQVCLTDQTNYFCLPWCRVGGSDCVSGTCNTLSLTVNSQEYGYCQ